MSLEHRLIGQLADGRPLSRPADAAVVTSEDRRRLGSLIADDQAWIDPLTAGQLEARLEDAAYVEREEVPETVVTMNTTVELVDLASRARYVVTLVYPDEAEFTKDGVSVLEPLGVALLGSSERSVIQCPDGPAAATLKIRRVLYQPEQEPVRYS